jgi:dTDP-4-amino-4,6-dideoxygalactose transaminase
MGVFSLNVHKHIQCGEGGMVVTDSFPYAEKIESCINHGELYPGYIYHKENIGGNFRMTEPIAAIACAQLKKGLELVKGRIALAEAITDIFKDVPFVQSPHERVGEVHAYYMWAGTILGEGACDIRHAFVTRLRARGVPFREGYSKLLHKLFEEDCTLPVAEEIENERLFTFEVCAYDPKQHHLRRMRDIILEEADRMEGEINHGTQEERGERSDGGCLGLA